MPGKQTPEEIAAREAWVLKVRQLAEEGLSARKIGARLRKDKNFVLGLCKRHGIELATRVEKPEVATAARDELLVKIRELAALGCSSRDIGQKIGKSKNSVIGLCFRWGIDLLSRSGPKTTRVRRRLAGPRKIVRHEKSDSPKWLYDPAEDAKALMIKFEDLDSKHCRWIFGDVKGLHGYCGRDIEKATPLSFCAYHTDRANGRITQRQEGSHV